MAAAESKESGFNTTVVVFGVVTTLIFLYAISLFLQGGFLAEQALELDAKTNSFPNDARLAHEAEQEAILHEKVRWLDKEKGIACLPIDDAIDRLVAIQATGTARD